MIHSVKPQCPCGRKFAPVAVGESAVEAVYRTCRKCGQRSYIIVRPIRKTKNGEGFIHIAEVLPVWKPPPRAQEQT